MTIPFDLLGYLTVPGITLLAALVGLWARKVLADWRWTPLVILGVCEAIVIVLRLVIGGDAQQMALTALLCFVAVSIETFGYETIFNVLGKVGVGHRSDTAQLVAAKDVVMDAVPRGQRTAVMNLLSTIKTE